MKVLLQAGAAAALALVVLGAWMRVQHEETELAAERAAGMTPPPIPDLPSGLDGRDLDPNAQLQPMIAPRGSP